MYDVQCKRPAKRNRSGVFATRNDFIWGTHRHRDIDMRVVGCVGALVADWDTGCSRPEEKRFAKKRPTTLWSVLGSGAGEATRNGSVACPLVIVWWLV